MNKDYAVYIGSNHILRCTHIHSGIHMELIILYKFCYTCDRRAMNIGDKDFIDIKFIYREIYTELWMAVYA